jgi:hypothetical protein
MLGRLVSVRLGWSTSTVGKVGVVWCGCAVC